MSSTLSIKANNSSKSEFSGKLVLTDYGHNRLLQKIAQGSYYNTLNLNEIGLGSKLNNSYDSHITEMGCLEHSFKIKQNQITCENNEFTIKTELDVAGEMNLREIGLYEYKDGEEHLFAYASGFDIAKSGNVSYSLVIHLSLSKGFENVHYNNYEVSLNDTEYALIPAVVNLFALLTDFQLDFEHCIARNARSLGYFTPQVFIEKQRQIASNINTALTFNRYQKILKQVGKENLKDCFFFIESDSSNYALRNLADEGSKLVCTGNLQKCNYDNIDLSVPVTLIVTTTISGSLTDGVIIGKMNPDEDEGYWDLKVVDNTIQFTIYSYDYHAAASIAAGKDVTDEKYLVGQFRAVYHPTATELLDILDGETMFTFTYNGNKDNPKLRMFLGTKEVTKEVVSSKVNFMGPCPEFKNTCTLMNYSQTPSGGSNITPSYYVNDNIKLNTFMHFNKELTLDDIEYLSLVFQV